MAPQLPNWFHIDFLIDLARNLHGNGSPARQLVPYCFPYCFIDEIDWPWFLGFPSGFLLTSLLLE